MQEIEESCARLVVFSGVFRTTPLDAPTVRAYIEKMENRFEVRFEVRPDSARQGLGVFATVPIGRGAQIGFFNGTPSLLRSRMSLQFGAELFIEPGPHDPLRNLNHACEPSAYFIGRDLFARRDLVAGEALTIDYNLHESSLASPFACNCGAGGCVGEVRGWIHLSAAEQKARRPWAGAWLSP